MNQGLNTTDDVFTNAPLPEPVVDEVDEKEALARAKKEGIEFVDTYQVEDDDHEYATRKEAEEAAKKAGGKLNIIQVRRQK